MTLPFRLCLRLSRLPTMLEMKTSGGSAKPRGQCVDLAKHEAANPLSKADYGRHIESEPFA
jgi:hypothetical protein